MRKWLVAACCGILVVLIVVACIVVYKELHRNSIPEETEDESSFPGERGVRILREKDPTDIIWYGKKYSFPNRYPFEFVVPVRYESEWTEETLRIRKGYNRAIIVISDRSGNMAISEDFLEKCVLRAINSKNYYFLYIGSERVDEILEIVKRNVSEFSEYSPISEDGIGSLGILQRPDGNVQYVFNPVIEPTDSEEDGWIWEYIAVAAEFGEFDGSAYKGN